MKNIKFEQKVLVVAHPDDEILFASSILKTIDLIIICFGGIRFEKDISKGRNKAILKFKEMGYKIDYLNIMQARETLSGINFLNFDKSILKNYLDLNPDEIYKNSKILEKQLLLKLKNATLVYTHNPWGEYGHMEHIQIFKVINKIRKKLNYEMFVTGYVSNLSKVSAIDSSYLVFRKPIMIKTNKLIYNSFKQIYLKNKCWTWIKNYKLPEYEYFYKVKKKRKNTLKKIQSNLILNYIYMGNPLFLITKKIIKLILPLKLRKKN